ncbi:MAG: hypothetical protein L0Y80_04000 [Ignavibacteriae bacterium]|nr:hypothetical protein [Ignavibacteriota bacterium]
MIASRRYYVLAGLLFIAPILLRAQDEPPPDMPMRGPAFERIERLKKIRLMEELRLDEETSVRFMSRYNAHQDELRRFQRQRQAAMAKVDDLRKSDASDAELEKAIQALRAFDSIFLELRDKHWQEVREILTTKQFATYVVFEHNFQRYLRELMRDVQRERGGRMMPRGR